MCTVNAHAKINLYLHVTGKRPNGYHELDSLVTFADIYDEIKIEQADQFSLTINGEFAATLNTDNNLITKAAQKLAQALGKDLSIAMTLNKSIPVEAGLGGGSADAAATIRGLLQFWNIDADDITNLDEILMTLGADVPVCFAQQPVRMTGIGEILTPAPHIPETHCVLVFPGVSSSTPQVFAHYKGPFGKPVPLPEKWQDQDDFLNFIKSQHNDLYPPARERMPIIDEALNALQYQTGCTLTRMLGSGSTCIGFFETEDQACRAADEIYSTHSNWWVKNTQLLKSRKF